MRSGGQTTNRRPAPDEQAPCEEVLLDRAREYDTEALGDLYDRYAGRIYAYICYRVGDETLAEDLTASVFVKMLRAIRSSRSWNKSFSAWLYRIAHNAVVDHFRRRDRAEELPLDERLVATGDNPPESVTAMARATAVGEVLGALTEDQQLVIIYKFFEGYSNREVAGMMGKTEGAIKSLQYRALASLRRHLGEAIEYEP